MTKRVCLVKDPRCGTYAGAQAHASHGEHLCSRCRPAYLEYHRDNSLLHNRARQRVLMKLKDLHPREYEAIYARHRRRAFAEAREDDPYKRVINRARQRALRDVSKNHVPEYQRLMTDELMRILMEESR